MSTQVVKCKSCGKPCERWKGEHFCTNLECKNFHWNSKIISMDQWLIKKHLLEFLAVVGEK